MEVLGIPVIVTDQLPTPISPAEEARRIVRHGLADIIRQVPELGPVGPAPDEVTHAFLVEDEGARYLLVSRRLHSQIQLINRLKAIAQVLTGHGRLDPLSGRVLSPAAEHVLRLLDNDLA